MSVTLSPLEHITTRRGCLASAATNASAFSYDPNSKKVIVFALGHVLNC